MASTKTKDPAELYRVWQKAKKGRAAVQQAFERAAAGSKKAAELFGQLKATGLKLDTAFRNLRDAVDGSPLWTWGKDHKPERVKAKAKPAPTPKRRARAR